MSVILLIQFVDVISENGKKFNNEDCKVVYPWENTYMNWEISQKKLRRTKEFGLPDDYRITTGYQSDIAMKNKNMKIEEICFPQRQGNRPIEKKSLNTT